MNFEYRALVDLVSYTIDSNIVTCNWVFTLNYNFNDIVGYHKACLVAKLR